MRLMVFNNSVFNLKEPMPARASAPRPRRAPAPWRSHNGCREASEPGRSGSLSRHNAQHHCTRHPLPPASFACAVTCTFSLELYPLRAHGGTMSSSSTLFSFGTSATL